MGAGLIGRRHIQHVSAEPQAELVAVVDPTDAGRRVAADNGAPWASSLRELLATERPDGVIIATPNQVHVENALEAVAAGIRFWWKSPSPTIWRRASASSQRRSAPACPSLSAITAATTRSCARRARSWHQGVWGGSWR